MGKHYSQFPYPIITSLFFRENVIKKPGQQKTACPAEFQGETFKTLRPLRFIKTH